ncbi:MAG: hypothetical protein KDK41_00630 [Leptospiraceae bacterium]|nr:hypothetical protein [Leptospiraceae bacterium]MCB1199118.1 hypothetical protein [Leptospiraceae bacterium]
MHYPQYENKTVTVTGKVFAGKNSIQFINGQPVSFRSSGLICTSLYCTERNACCNQCYSQMSVADNDAKDKTLIAGSITLQGVYQNREISCQGDNCAVTCSLPEGSSVSITGKFYSTGTEYKEFRINIEEMYVID